MAFAYASRGGNTHALGRAFDLAVDAVDRAQIVLRQHRRRRATAKNAAVIEQIKAVAKAGSEA